VNSFVAEWLSPLTLRSEEKSNKEGYLLYMLRLDRDKRRKPWNEHLSIYLKTMPSMSGNVSMSQISKYAVWE
jgi:hypothetical protein